MSDHDTQHENGHQHAHHFASAKQQYESDKFGMWVFLATEILMFGGLFCAYAIYRHMHPEVFLYAHKYLDTNLGATNTIVLLASSLTMAWAVRAAQLGKQKVLLGMLVLTFCGGIGFMVIKSIEYKSKFSHDLYPGTANLFYHDPGNPENQLWDADGELVQHRLDEIHHLEAYYMKKYMPGYAVHNADGKEHGQSHDASQNAAGHDIAAQGDHAQAAQTTAQDTTQPEPTLVRTSRFLPAAPADHTAAPLPATGPRGAVNLVDGVVGDTHAAHGIWTFESLPETEQKRVHMFFQIYYLMTGLHGIHVLVGMGVILFLIIKTIKGAYSSSYFTPVDIGGLYWHLVDLIWIFLFPLLYLIH